MTDSWSNEDVLEFVHLYGQYPVIWNPTDLNHKSRIAIRQAWADIQKKMSQRIECTVDSLKRKKESLMTTYRICKKKIAETQNTDNVYKPSWFAFSVLDKYLGKYRRKYQNMKKYEPTESDEDVADNAEEGEEEEESYAEETAIEEINLPVYTATTSKLKRKADTSLPDTDTNVKISRGCEKANECELYGQLIASRLKHISKRNRLILMNQIDNLIFQYQMKDMNDSSVSFDNSPPHIKASSDVE